MGEKVEFPRSERAWDILAAMTYQIMSTIGDDHFWIQDVRAELDPLEWRSRRRLLLRSFRASLDTWVGRQLFRSGFKGLRAILFA
jgi:hypothetical protein